MSTAQSAPRSEPPVTRSMTRMQRQAFTPIPERKAKHFRCGCCDTLSAFQMVDMGGIQDLLVCHVQSMLLDMKRTLQCLHNVGMCILSFLPKPPHQTPH